VKVNRCSGLKVENKKENCDSKLILLLVVIGYVVGLGNIWCFCTWYRRVGWLSAEGGSAVVVKGEGI
jgi:SNF family Na+-dependent transporter